MILHGTQEIDQHGVLTIGGCLATDLAERFGTPLYVLDEACFRANCRRYLAASRAAYENSDVAFASKALMTSAVVRICDEEDLWLDVASPGEMLTAQRAAFPMSRTIYHGSNKSLAEIRAAVAANVGLIVVDWLGELEQIEQAGAEAGRKVPILLRLAPGVDPDTHHAIRTGQPDTKFGLSIRGEAADAGVAAALALPHVQLLGYHSHVGSQLLDMEAHHEAVVEMVQFAARMAARHGYSPAILNIGGGLGIRYTEQDEPPSFEEFHDQLVRTLTEQLRLTGLEPPKLMQEPGRSLVAEAGTTLYTVGAIKHLDLPTGQQRIYVSVDGGLSDNPRPQMYGAVYECALANRMNDPADTECRIAGAHCETDTLIASAELPMPRTGDLLAVPCTGAYCYSMASNYNRFQRPAMVLAHDGQAEIIVERETPEDVLRMDRIPERLRCVEDRGIRA
ncbi:MAG: diaminopimelate decarboxylase [Fimbriimonadales bacterium]